MRPALLIGTAVLFASAAARADNPRPAVPHHALQFVYKLGPGTQSCPSEQVMQHLLLGAFGYDPIDPKAETRIEIDVTRRNGGFHTEILISGAGDALLWVDQMDDPDRCMLLMRNAVVAAMVHARIILDPPRAPDPPAKPAPAPVEPAPEPSPSLPRSTSLAPAPVPLGKKARAAAPASAVAAPWTPWFGAGLEANVGLVPGLGGGGHVVAEVEWLRFSLGGEARVLTSILSGSEGGAQRALVRGVFVGGSALPCFRYAPWALCGAITAGTIDGGAVQGFPGRVAAPLIVALGGRMGFKPRMKGPLAVQGFIEVAGIPISSFADRDLGHKPVGDTPRAYASAGVTLIVHP